MLTHNQGAKMSYELLVVITIGDNSYTYLARREGSLPAMRDATFAVQRELGRQKGALGIQKNQIGPKEEPSDPMLRHHIACGSAGHGTYRRKDQILQVFREQGFTLQRMSSKSPKPSAS